MWRAMRRAYSVKVTSWAAAVFFGMGGSVPEFLFRSGEAVRFQLDGLAGRVLADDEEVAIVRDENEPVFSPIAADLLALGGDPSVVRSWLDLDDAAGRVLRQRFFFGLALFELIFGEEPAVGAADTTILELKYAAHFGLQGFPNFVEESLQGAVVGGFVDGLPAGTDFSQGREIGFERCHVCI